MYISKQKILELCFWVFQSSFHLPELHQGLLSFVYSGDACSRENGLHKQPSLFKMHTILILLTRNTCTSIPFPVWNKMLIQPHVTLTQA